MLESKIQKRFTDWMDKRGIKWSKAIVNSKSSDPDIVICYQGKYVGCEAKQVGKKPTEAQAKKLWTIHLSGGLAFYADNLDDFVAHLRGVSTFNCVQAWYVEPKDREGVLEL